MADIAENRDALKHVRNLVFRGGGPKGIVYPGAQQALEEFGLMPQIERIAGSSAGAITAIAIGLGLTSEDTKQLLSNQKISELLDSKPDSNLIQRDFSVDSKAGMYYGDTLYNMLRTQITEGVAERVKEILQTRFEETSVGENKSKHWIYKDKLTIESYNAKQKKLEAELNLANKMQRELNDKINFALNSHTYSRSSIEYMQDRLKLGNLEKQISDFRNDIEKIKNERQKFVDNIVKLLDLKKNIEANANYKINFADVALLNSFMPDKVKKIYITGTNVTNNQLQFFCAEHTPDTEVALAARISASLPGVYMPVEYKGKRYIDGGAADNFPVKYFLNEKTPETQLTTLGFIPSNKPYVPYEENKKLSLGQRIKNFIVKLFYKIDRGSYDAAVGKEINHYILRGNCKVVELPIDKVGTFSFHLTPDEKTKLHNNGYMACTDALNRICAPAPQQSIQMAACDAVESTYKQTSSFRDMLRSNPEADLRYTSSKSI
jgi:predicted acylesterase/phospholipase RssA